MNIAPKTIHAASSASFRVRSSAVLIVVSSLLLGGVSTGVLAAPPEQANQVPIRKDEAAQRFENRAPRQAEQRPDPRYFELRAEEQRRAVQQQEQSRSELTQRSGRLTADERRDLRRQINEAGQDIYANPPRR